MILLTENAFSKKVESMLQSIGRKYSNIQGSNFGKNNGDPDIITLDKEGRYLALELKIFGGKCYPNQYNQMREILKSKGRVFILFPDVFLEHLTEEFPLQRLSIDESQSQNPQFSHELILEEKGDCRNEK